MTIVKTNSVDSSSSKNTTQSQPQQQHRRNWFFQRHNGNTTTTSAAAAASSTTTPRSRKGTNTTISSSTDETPKTNNRTITLQQQQQPSSVTSTSTTTISSTTGTTGTNHTIPPPPINPPGILKKQTKDYDAIVAASKQISFKSTKNTKNNTTTISWLCRTKYFQKICHMAYEAIDSDQSGQIDEKELYAGLLLIHLQLGMYAGPAACRPLSRDQVHTIFKKMDNDGNGTLNETEFQHIMSVLFSNVLLRVMVQWTMTLMIVPWLAQFILNGILYTIAYITMIITNLDEFILNGILYTIAYITMIITNLDEHSQVFNIIELTIEGTTLYIHDHLIPNIIKSIFTSIQYGISMVPISVWKALPLTLLSTVLGIVVVPYCIFQIDTYFSKLADKYHSRYNNDPKKKVM